MPISWKGTLAQYVGRLHRNYEGKNEVRIYDYVDVHIPTLERMYHKRIKGYAELGYQIKFGAQDRNVSTIYDGHAAMETFDRDIADAVNSIVVFSPYIQSGRVSKLLPVLQETITAGVTIAIHTKEAESYEKSKQSECQGMLAQLRNIGVQVTTHQVLQPRCAIIDKKIVWYGSVDFLAFGRRDSDALRFVDSDTAGEFLNLYKEVTGEQTMIEEV